MCLKTIVTLQNNAKYDYQSSIMWVKHNNPAAAKYYQKRAALQYSNARILMEKYNEDVHSST